jgi:hypothetical protein
MRHRLVDSSHNLISESLPDDSRYCNITIPHHSDWFCGQLALCASHLDRIILYSGHLFWTVMLQLSTWMVYILGPHCAHPFFITTAFPTFVQLVWLQVTLVLGSTMATTCEKFGVLTGMDQASISAWCFEAKRLVLYFKVYISCNIR